MSQQAMLAALTPSEKRALTRFREEYIEIGLSAEPIDRGRAEAAIVTMYRSIGRPPPRFVAFSSPWACMAAMPQLRNEAGDNLKDQINNQLAVQLTDRLGAQLWGKLNDMVWPELWHQPWGRSLRELRDHLRDQIEEQLAEQLRNEVVSQPNWGYLWGQHESLWLAYPLWPARHFNFPYPALDLEILNCWDEVARSCGWWWPMENICVLSDRPAAPPLFDAAGRLHSLTGPAVQFRDGWKMYVIHDVRVPAAVVDDPMSLTAERILSEPNAEVRRCMIDRVGYERFLSMSGAQPINEDRRGKLYRIELNADQPLTVVKVVNSTPEPDGSYKHYLLRVPPTMHTATEAVAWTFGLDEKEYQPDIET